MLGIFQKTSRAREGAIDKFARRLLASPRFLLQRRPGPGAVSIAISSSTVAGMTTGLLTLPLYRYMNATSFLPLFIVPSLLCLINLYRQLPETKNKEIYEIVRELRGGSTDSDSCLGVNML
uniref:Uncharacterized protein n=1 Tax=Plectus sambesii TaxID=2011161 RepID=A0A914WCE6_9BILA